MWLNKCLKNKTVVKIKPQCIVLELYSPQLYLTGYSYANDCDWLMSEKQQVLVLSQIDKIHITFVNTEQSPRGVSVLTVFSLNQLSVPEEVNPDNAPDLFCGEKVVTKKTFYFFLDESLLISNAVKMRGNDYFNRCPHYIFCTQVRVTFFEYVFANTEF